MKQIPPKQQYLFPNEQKISLDVVLGWLEAFEAVGQKTDKSMQKESKMEESPSKANPGKKSFMEFFNSDEGYTLDEFISFNEEYESEDDDEELEAEMNEFLESTLG